jgi:hypothetical protein
MPYRNFQLPSSVMQLLSPYLAPLFGRLPASKLIRHSARRHWKLLAVMLGTGLLGSFWRWA